MFLLYKNRGFGDIISDTFTFLKVSGKHFFYNYFAITGIFLLILLVFTYFFSTVYYEYMFSSMSMTYGTNPMDELFGDNLGFLILVIAGFFVMGLFVSLLTFSFPVSYFQLYEKNNYTTNFTTRDIITQMKSTFGRLCIYFLGLVFIFMPIFLISYVIIILLSIIIIGIPLLFIILPAIFSWMFLTLFYQLNSNDGFFSAMGKAWEVIKTNFWKTIGSTLVMYVIVSVLVGIIIMVPYLIAILSVFGAGTTNALDGTQTGSLFGMMMTIVMVLSILLNFITNNLHIITHGMIYYSVMEEKENRNQHSEIDLIGTED